MKDQLVAEYELNPDRPSSNGLGPCVARTAEGDQMVDGKHRALAARRAHRMLDCHLYTEEA